MTAILPNYVPTEGIFPLSHTSPLVQEGDVGNCLPRPILTTISPTDPQPVTLGPSPSRASAFPSSSTTRRAKVSPADEAVDTKAGTGDHSNAKEAPGFVQPHAFYPLHNQLSPASIPNVDPVTGWAYGSEGIFLSPEDDKEAIRGIPIFKPTLEEFKDFEAYVTKTVAWGQYSGITKIIPPDDWKGTLPPISKQRLSDIRIRNPIQQNMFGSGGLFRQRNVEKCKTKPLTVEQWFDKCRTQGFAGPGPKDPDLTTDKDSKEAKEARARKEADIKVRKEQARIKRREQAERKERKAKGDLGQPIDETAAVGPSTPQASSSAHIKADVTDQDGDVAVTPEVPALEPSSQQSSESSPDPLAITPEADRVSDWYQNFDPSTTWLAPDTQPEDYTPEACASMERKFWKNMGIGEPGWYGADLQGSLFEDPDTPWNVARLPNLLNRFKEMGRSLPGVNEPYLYFGMWRAAFAWHVEDMDLFSINFIHFGAPKYWYAIPQLSAMKFERVLAGYFAPEAQSCDQFLRHKAYTVSPHKLAQDNIRVNMLVHNQGEYVITYPRGYHSGFNMGFNCAESVNFALESWLELGRRAKVCKCVTYSVRIDVDELMGVADKRKEQEECLKLEAELAEAIQKQRSVRKRITNGDTPRRSKKQRIEIVNGDGDIMAIDGSDAFDHPNLPAGMPEIKKEIVLNVAPKRPTVVKEPASYPCLLCPSLEARGLLLVFEPNDYVKSLSRSRKPLLLAHTDCAASVTETYTDAGLLEGQPVDWAKGVNDIPKDRWNLKCSLCRDKKLAAMGAKIQCTKGKCPKAFHVTCAIAHEDVSIKVERIEIDVQLPVPADAPEGTQPQVVKEDSLQTRLLCAVHNPVVVERRRREQAEAMRAKVIALSPGQSIKIRSGGDIEEVQLAEIFEGSRKVKVWTAKNEEVVVDWSRIDWRPAPLPLKENEYARDYAHSRKTSTGIESVPVTKDSTPAIHTYANAPRASRPISVGPSAPRPQPVPNPAHHPVHGLFSQTTYSPTYYPQAPPGLLSGQRISIGAICHGPTSQVPSRVVMVDSVRFGESCNLPPLSSLADRGIYPGPPPFYQTSQYSTAPTPSPMLYPPPLACPQQPNGYPSYPRFTPPSMAPASWLPLSAPAYPQVYPWSGATNYHDQPYGGMQQIGPNHAGHGRAPLQDVSSSMSVLGGTSQAKPIPAGVGKIDLGLDRMEKIMSWLPPLRTPAIHIAGTNGKGSVSAILESCLTVAGFHVARYNSPHLIEPRDAVRVNGRPLETDDYAAALNMIHHYCEGARIAATTFEIATAAAFYLINRSSPDIMIIECGMGGHKDATNVIPPNRTLASLLTSVGLDHTAFLGDSVEAIAAEKSKIVVENGLLFVGPQTYPEVVQVARNIAASRNALVIEAMSPVDVAPSERSQVTLEPFAAPLPRTVSVTLPSLSGQPLALHAHVALPGAHQLDNLALALTVLHGLRQDKRAIEIQSKLAGLSDEVLVAGAAAARWAGRCSWEVYKDRRSGLRIPLLIDGAHNSDSAKTLRDYIDSLDFRPGRRETTFITSLSESKGKSVESVLLPLLRPGDRAVLVDFSSPVEGMPWVHPVDKSLVERAAQAIVKEDGAVRVQDGSGPAAIHAALRWATADWQTNGEGLVVVCGSLYLVADAYRLLGKKV